MSRRFNSTRENSYDYHSKHLQTLKELIFEVAENYSKILPIRIDFHLTSSARLKVDRQDFIDYWHAMQNNIRHNQKFKDLITYVAKLEYGRNRGWHMHLLLLFDGQKIKYDVDLSKELGAYWKQVVNARGFHEGHFHSCNMNKDSYVLCGLNMINSSHALHQIRHEAKDDTDLDKLINATKYLTKIDQSTEEYLTEQGYMRKPRTIFFGRVKPKSNAGRPRRP